jgi:hypothetical protein
MENTTLLLNAISDLKQFTTNEIDRLYKSQEERFERIEEQLTRLNGKVAEHERRFVEADGAEKLRRRQQERMAMLNIAPSSVHDSDEFPADLSKHRPSAAVSRTPFYREVLQNRFLVAMLTLIVITGMFILGGQGILQLLEKWGQAK